MNTAIMERETTAKTLAKKREGGIQPQLFRALPHSSGLAHNPLTTGAW